MDIGDIPGWIALVLSSSILLKGIVSSRIRLKMKFHSADVVWYEDNCSIVIFHLDFVNHSSKVQIVNDVQVSTPLVITHRQYPFQMVLFAFGVFPFYNAFNMSDELREFVARYLWGIIEWIFFLSIFAWFISVLNSIGCLNPAFEGFEWTEEKQEAANKILELLGLVSSITFWTSFVSLLGRWLYRRTRGIRKFIGKVK